jgi:hypothetical protein
VTPLLLAAAGVAALVSALALLRSFGSGYRIGRLLAAVPAVAIAEAVQLAASGERRYVRIDGRIDSEAEFEDADHRPLVLRRTTIAWRPATGRGTWTPFDARLEAVPFVVREGLDEIAVDGAAIADGLVVVARESVGEARALEALPAAGIDPGSEALLRVEQVSSVEHATVLGVPVRAPDGTPTIGPGLGRPLIVTTLEGDEAMRVLTGGASGKARLVVALLAAGGILLVAALLWWLADALVGGGAAAALAASPEPSLRPGSDTRSSGGGPGLVGDPLLAIVGVAAVALTSVLASLAYIRLTRGPEGTPRRR